LQVWRDGPNAARSPRICTLRNAADPVDQLPADQMAANARLIAAAPDLLEALHQVRDEHGYGLPTETLQQIDAAIARVEARS
jgi:type VI protein secretion system component VasF